jgi:DNA-binding XRE family transcriptional regulator
MNHPTPWQIYAARVRAGLTQAEAANLVYLQTRQAWSAYESGRLQIPLVTWELFLIKTGQK